MAENPQGRTVSEGSWLDSLPARRLFSHLREKGSSVEAGGNMMCMIKENLFIWSQEELALLTVNLKRLCASPTEDIFQVCFPYTVLFSAGQGPKFKKWWHLNYT